MASQALASAPIWWVEGAPELWMAPGRLIRSLPRHVDQHDVTYQYAATIVRVVDGDTVVVNIDLGFGVWLHEQNFRLLGINAREKSQPGGREAGENLRQLLPAGTSVSLTSVKPDKFGGRYDAHLTLPGGGVVSALLIETGWAAAWDGRGTKPVPAWPRSV